MKNILLGLALLLLTPGLALGQDAVVTGTVTSTEGETLPGANVFIEELRIGAATDVEGVYSIEIPGDEIGQQVTLTAQFIGYAPSSQMITLSEGTSTYDFALEPDLFDLEEVVVTGVVGETAQKKLAFSVGTVGEDELEKVPAVNISTALEGKVAGVRVNTRGGLPGEAASISLRGVTSIAGGQEPLIIVDGVILEGSLADINAQDIQSIEVVKGAAAASLYGSKAANGVIQIFTKDGSGLAAGQIQVTVRNEYGRSFLGDQLPLATHHPYSVNDQGEFLDEDGNPIEFGAGRVFADTLYHWAINDYAVVRDHQRAIFEPGTFYTNYISVGGNTENGNYYVSFSNTQKEGIIFGQKGYGRQNVRVNLDQDILPDLELSVSTLFGTSDNDRVSQGPGSPFFSLLFAEPDAPLYRDNPNGQPYYLAALRYANEPNPLYALAFNDRLQERARFLGNARLTYSPIYWFTLEGNFGIDRQNETYENYFPKGYLQIDGTAPENVSPTAGSLYKDTFNERALNTSLTASFNQQFGPLESRLSLSYLYEESQYEYFEAEGNDFGIGGLPNLDAIVGDESVGSYISDIRSENFFAILGLDLYDTYIVDFLVRRDGSSLFGPEERWHTYFRTSGAYRISEDIDLPGINELKVRASYGTAGLRPDFADQYETYSLVGGIPTKSTLGNRALEPALSKEQSYGIDITFLDRFSGSFTYAHTDTEGQILSAPLPAPSGGFPSQIQNVGTLTSTAYEASLGAVLMQRDDFLWRANAVFSKTSNVVSELDRPAFFIGPDFQNAEVFYVAEDEPLGVIYGIQWATSFDQLSDDANPDNYVINNDGYVVNRYFTTASDEQMLAAGTIHEAPVAVNGGAAVPIGNVIPDFTMGFTSTVNWKGFQVYGLIDWKQGGDVYNQTRQWIFREYRSGIMDQTGVPEGERHSVEYYLAFYDANSANSFFIEDGSFVKLKELSVRYTFDNDLLGRFGVGGLLESASVAVIGRNLLTFTDYTGYDPEVAGIDGDASIFKFDGYGYPNFRTFTGSLEFVF